MYRQNIPEADAGWNSAQISPSSAYSDGERTPFELAVNPATAGFGQISLGHSIPCGAPGESLRGPASPGSLWNGTGFSEIISAPLSWPQVRPIPAYVMTACDICWLCFSPRIVILSSWSGGGGEKVWKRPEEKTQVGDHCPAGPRAGLLPTTSPISSAPLPPWGFGPFPWGGGFFSVACSWLGAFNTLLIPAIVPFLLMYPKQPILCFGSFHLAGACRWNDRSWFMS